MTLFCVKDGGEDLNKGFNAPLKKVERPTPVKDTPVEKVRDGVYKDTEGKFFTDILENKKVGYLGYCPITKKKVYTKAKPLNENVYKEIAENYLESIKPIPFQESKPELFPIIRPRRTGKSYYQELIEVADAVLCNDANEAARIRNMSGKEFFEYMYFTKS